MKTPFLTRNAAGVSLGLLISAVFASHAIAGPGPQYWQSVGKPKAPAVEQAAPAAAAIPVCPGSEIVPVTTMKSPQSNGRPPFVAVQTGTQRVCHLCTSTTVTTTNDWPSHRGPAVQKVETTKVGAPHVCTSACKPAPNA